MTTKPILGRWASAKDEPLLLAFSLRCCRNLLQPPQGAPLLLLNIPSGFTFVFPPCSKAGGQKRGRGGVCHVNHVHHSRGMSGCTGSNPRASYSDTASSSHSRMLVFCPGFRGFTTTAVKVTQ